MSASGQWLSYPTPGMPRTADDKPNLSAPVPKAADGKPSLSGLWVRVRSSRERVTALAMGPNLEDFMSLVDTIIFTSSLYCFIRLREGSTRLRTFCHYFKPFGIDLGKSALCQIVGRPQFFHLCLETQPSCPVE